MAHHNVSIEVRPVRSGRGVFALRDFGVGDEILRFDGRIVNTPNRRTLQLSATEHLDVPGRLTEEDLETRHPWRYLNHGCRPNAKLRQRSLIAVAPIEAEEEVLFNYETTEWDMAEPFPCGCGACDGRLVRGARHLSPMERRALRSLMSPHVIQQLTLEDGPES